jgi:predicted MPP superfamily phosphohydrolase
MRQILLACLLSLFLFKSYAQSPRFRFAFISDTHIGSPDGSAEEDLRRTVRDINAMDDIAFVVLTGDITELGTTEELWRAKNILDSLRVKWYIIPGNHDSGWSESGGLMFTKIFGSDHFNFEYEGIRFIGCASGPFLRMSDGHVPRDAVNWLDKSLKELKKDQPLVFLNHYPINDQLDNWYEITDRLHNYNTWAILCGHGHTNKAFDFEGIPGVMGRSNLRARQALGGFNLVDVRNDSLLFSERKPGQVTMAPWTRLKLETHHYDLTKKYSRPDYSINDQYPTVKENWVFSSAANIISTPYADKKSVVVGNQQGEVTSFDISNGKTQWTFQAAGPVYSSLAGNEQVLVFGGADGTVYCVGNSGGKLIWKYAANTAVLGSPIISKGKVFRGQ